MDVSSNYIKMCEKAVEIQEPWVISGRNIGDFYYNLHTHHRDIWKAHNKLASDFDIWLPRQDQLQEIYCAEYAFGLRWFYEFAIVNQIKFNSMEQIWLAFAMQEKYGKVWDGKDWK